MENQKVQKIKFLSEKEVRLIIDNIRTNQRYGLKEFRDRAVLEVLFSTGLRIAELMSLPDAPFINCKERTLELSITGKGNKQRVIYFSPRALTAIKEYLKRRKDDDSLLLFGFSKRTAQNIVKRRAGAVGLSWCHAHTFRHSFATHILGKTGNLRLTQEMLGHKNISTTQIYASITNKELKDAHIKLFN